MPNKTTAKKVSFFDLVTVEEALHINDYSDDEKAACWLSRKEENLIEREIRNTKTMMRISEQTARQIDSDFICTRGLEDFDRVARSIATEVVLEEQDMQWEQRGVCDPEELAEIYSVTTRECEKVAILKGRADQAWVASQMFEMPLSRRKRPDNEHVQRRVTVPAGAIWQRQL